jgi:IclR family acetate operon transcriptional repressor
MKRASAEKAEPAYPVAGAGNVLRLIRLLEERQCVKLTDVSSELGIGPSTAHRLLAMFRQFGFVEQEERGHVYRVGPGLLSVAKTLSARHRMLVRIRPILESLVEGLNETVHVAMLKGSMVTYIDCVESGRSERATSRTGRVMPSYATASGKALLANLPRADIESLFPSEVLAPLTCHTIATREALLQDISRTTYRGFATNESESQLGFFACSSVIKSEAGIPRTAIVIAGPSRRFRRNHHRFADQLCVAAEEAGRAI